MQFALVLALSAAALRAPTTGSTALRGRRAAVQTALFAALPPLCVSRAARADGLASRLAGGLAPSKDMRVFNTGEEKAAGPAVSKADAYLAKKKQRLSADIAAFQSEEAAKEKLQQEQAAALGDTKVSAQSAADQPKDASGPRLSSSVSLDALVAQSGAPK